MLGQGAQPSAAELQGLGPPRHKHEARLCRLGGTDAGSTIKRSRLQCIQLKPPGGSRPRIQLVGWRRCPSEAEFTIQCAPTTQQWPVLRNIKVRPWGYHQLTLFQGRWICVSDHMCLLPLTAVVGNATAIYDNVTFNCLETRPTSPPATSGGYGLHAAASVTCVLLDAFMGP